MTRLVTRVRAGRTGLGVAAVLVLLATGCSGGEPAPTPVPSSSASTAADPETPESPESPETSEPTTDPEVVERALSLQSAQRALGESGRGTFEVLLTDGERGGVLPSVEGSFDVAAPAGAFTATTVEADRRVVLRFRTRGEQAWSQVLYPGSPLAPDCWYQLAVAPGAVALPAQVSALFSLQPDAAAPETDLTVLLVDALNAVGLTRLANQLDDEAAAARVPVQVRLRGEGEASRVAAWSLTGADLADVLADQGLAGPAQRALAEVAPVLDDAAWRVVLERGDPGRVSAPPARSVLVAGDVCPAG